MITILSFNVRYGSKADIQRRPLECPLLGVERTLNVRFQRPATDPAGAEDVTDMLGKRHGFAGHEYVACMVVLGREVMGFDGSVRVVIGRWVCGSDTGNLRVG